MSAKIKFSHIYRKLLVAGQDGFPHPTATARLLLVTSLELDELNKHFVDYDTDNGKYQLTYQTVYLMLVFMKTDGNIFTTLRPQYGAYGNKKKYYQDLIGQDFEIIVPSSLSSGEGRGGVKAPLHSIYHEQAEARAKIQRELK